MRWPLPVVEGVPLGRGATSTTPASCKTRIKKTSPRLATLLLRCTHAVPLDPHARVHEVHRARAHHPIPRAPRDRRVLRAHLVRRVRRVPLLQVLQVLEKSTIGRQGEGGGGGYWRIDDSKKSGARRGWWLYYKGYTCDVQVKCVVTGEDGAVRRPRRRR